MASNKAATVPLEERIKKTEKERGVKILLYRLLLRFKHGAEVKRADVTKAVREELGEVHIFAYEVDEDTYYWAGGAENLIAISVVDVWYCLPTTPLDHFITVDPCDDEPLLRGRHTWMFGPFVTEEKAREWGDGFVQAARAGGLSVRYYHFSPIIGTPEEVLNLVYWRPPSNRGPIIDRPAKPRHPKSVPFVDPSI